jgi:4-aminobutyrate aminotransferase-like enzyme
MAIRRARGATVEDVDGNIYIDFFGGAGVMNVGHANPAVSEAASKQLSELTHSLDIPNPARKALVENLLTLLPKDLNRIFFGGPTGSDAVEAALKLAKYNSRRYPLIAFEGGYHGMSLIPAAWSASNIWSMSSRTPILVWEGQQRLSSRQSREKGVRSFPRMSLFPE